MYTELVPAYGRDYRTAKAARADWHANKDFIICNLFHPYDGKYINREQVSPGEKYTLRFCNRTKTCTA